MTAAAREELLWLQNNKIFSWVPVYLYCTVLYQQLFKARKNSAFGHKQRWCAKVSYLITKKCHDSTTLSANYIYVLVSARDAAWPFIFGSGSINWFRIQLMELESGLTSLTSRTRIQPKWCGSGSSLYDTDPDPCMANDTIPDPSL